VKIQIRLDRSEQLDNLSLSGKPLKRTLLSLKLINYYLGNHRQLSKAVLHYCKTNPDKKEFRVVDLGCGGGDCVYQISKKLKKHHINASFLGIDGNPNSISYARKNNVDHNNINFITADILNDDFEIPDCDLLISSHFIYHFKNDDFVNFLTKLKAKNINHVIFSELYRSKVAYYLFKLGTYVAPISSMAKKDGLIAIQRAFTIKEMIAFIKKSNIKEFIITKKPLFRTITQIDLQNERNTNA